MQSPHFRKSLETNCSNLSYLLCLECLVMRDELIFTIKSALFVWISIFLGFGLQTFIFYGIDLDSFVNAGIHLFQCPAERR